MIYEILYKGEENAQTSAVICSMLNITKEQLKTAVRRERKAGKPICAKSTSPAGYYIAPDKETMQDFCNRLRHREKEIAKTRRACNKTIKKLPERETVTQEN